jgi:hypothetical protein
MARNEISEAEGLAECVSQAIQEYMARCDVNRIWPDVERLSRPQLRLDVSLGDAGKASKKVVTVCIFLPSPIYTGYQWARASYWT